MIIIITGKKHPDSNDFLEGRIFNENHPNGDQIEVYIITSNNGAKEIINRIKSLYHHLINRIDSMIIPFSNNDDDDSIDIRNIPNMIYSKLGMKIVNHDGGRHILNDFIKCGALAQLNLTLGKQLSLKRIIEKRDENNNTFDQNKCQYFFSRNDDNNSNSIPQVLKPFQIILDELSEAAIVCFNTNNNNISL